MSLLVTTDAVPDAEKAGFWGAAVSRTLVPVEVVPLADRPFEGRLVSHRLGYLRVSTLEADATRVSRSASLIARSPQAEAQVGVAVQVSGRAVLAQEGRRAPVPAGSLVLYDTTRPYAFDYPERFSTHPAPSTAQAAGGGGAGHPAGGGDGRHLRRGARSRPAALPRHPRRLRALLPGLRRRSAGRQRHRPARHARRPAHRGGHRPAHPGRPSRPTGTGAHRPPPGRPGTLTGDHRRRPSHLGALPAPPLRRREHHGEPAHPATPLGGLRPRPGPAQPHRTDGVSGRPALGVRQPGPLQPRLPRRLRGAPAGVARAPNSRRS